tara:strand:- start:352 stop:726 length:375 start_codon:yes stop_codon:yes gene_type:complete
MKKFDNAYKSIGEVAEILNLKDKGGKLSTHTLRFWEKNFKQIKPKFFNSNRRYYDSKTIEILVKIKHLLKVDGIKIEGVKKILNKDTALKLDDLNNKTINRRDTNLLLKVNKISKIIKDIKKIK